MKMLLLIGLLATASCAAGDTAEPARTAKAEGRLDQFLAGKVASQPQSCITRREAERQEVVDDRTIIFRVSSNRVIRNDISPSCPGLDRQAAIIRVSPSTSICRGEIFEVRDLTSGISYGSCTFGDFTEYRTPRR